MPTRNVDLTEYFDTFIDARVTSGRFSNASDVVREALRLLETREQEDQAKLEWLRGAAQEGFGAIDSGDSVALNSEEELDSYFKQLHGEVSAELHTERQRS